MTIATNTCSVLVSQAKHYKFQNVNDIIINFHMTMKTNLYITVNRLEFLCKTFPFANYNKHEINRQLFLHESAVKYSTVCT